MNKKKHSPTQQSFFEESATTILPQEKKSIHKSSIEDLDISKLGLEGADFGQYIESITGKTNSSKYDRQRNGDSDTEDI